MFMTDIIADKKFGRPLTREQLQFVSRGAADGSIPDYQLTALLMAIRLNGMTDQERADLTMAMAESGDMVDLTEIGAVCVDKHSTGGVGDTTTLILVPLVAACGVPVAKVSGRGLSHTGGTIDKMESIRGMRVEMDTDAFLKQVKQIGCAVIGQSPNIVPADKTLYSLRDVTSTVDSLPLIASSIMSKKLASGAMGIVLDVKTGSGALMPDLDGSITLAKAMVDIGLATGRKTAALVTGMAQPLGTHVGNALEVKEAIDVLAGRVQGDLETVSLALGSQMLLAAGKAKNEAEAQDMLQSALESGAGLNKFKEMIAAQGGDPRICDDVSLLPAANVVLDGKATQDGFIGPVDATALGLCALNLGAGRRAKSDMIDPSVGFVLHKRVGDRVAIGDTLFTVHAANAQSAEDAMRELHALIPILNNPIEKEKLIYALVDADGVTRY